MARITKAEKERRVTEVARFLLQGVGRAQILQYASNNGWKLTDRAVDNYIAAATEQIKAKADTDREYEIALAKERYEFLLTKNLAKSDYREARQVVKARAELLGIEMPKQVDLTSDGEKVEIVFNWKDANDND